MQGRRLDFLIFAALLIVGVAVYWPIFTIKPLDEDNLYVLAWIHAAPVDALLRLDPAIYPEWRPLAYALLWLEYRLVGLDGVAVHFAVNLLLWTACAWIVYLVVVELTASRAAAIVSALWLYVDQRSVAPLTWIIERQMLLACLFGSIALLIVMQARARLLSRGEAVTIALLLLASALGKEYGLAAALVIGGAGLWGRRGLQAAAALAAVVLYAGMRLMFAGGAVGGPFCEEMGFFFSVANRCVDPLSADDFPQLAYNAGATAIGSVVPSLFDDEGAIAIDYSGVALAAVFLAPAVVGVIKGPRVLWMVALLPAATAVISFMLYRTRSHLLVAAGVAMAAGTGLAMLALLDQRRRAWMVVAVVALAGALLVVRGYETRQLVATAVADLQRDDPCDAPVMAREFGRPFVRLVKETYGMPDAGCEAAR